jgi:hypothetical protein
LAKTLYSFMRFRLCFSGIRVDITIHLMSRILLSYSYGWYLEFYHILTMTFGLIPLPFLRFCFMDFRLN